MSALPTFDSKGVHISCRPIECFPFDSFERKHVNEADLLKANQMKEIVVQLRGVLV